MRMIQSKNVLVLSVLAGLLSLSAAAGVPVNNLQGVGGVAFNPLAYLAGTQWENEGQFPLGDFVRKPQVGVWYVNLSAVDVDWTSMSVATSLLDRLELSYARETIAFDGGPNIRKDNIGLKLLLLPENVGDLSFMPAVSAGTVWKRTSDSFTSEDRDFDFYLVGTKLITDPLPMPVLLSGGILYTAEWTTGVLGFDEDDRDLTGFFNINVIPHEKWAVGFEFKQGARYSNFKNANYWNAHVCHFATPNLTLIGAWTDTGNHRSASKVGCGAGFVFSMQYAF